MREKAGSPVGSTGSVVDSVKLESADTESSTSEDRKPSSDVDTPTSGVMIYSKSIWRLTVQ